MITMYPRSESQLTYMTSFAVTGEFVLGTMSKYRP